jgi:branched-chain amino acid transport system substrate-binding protein
MNPRRVWLAGVLRISTAVAAVLLILSLDYAGAEEPPLKIGVVMTYSGPYAFNGRQVDLGLASEIKAHGDSIAGRKIEIIRKDDTGLAPDVAKRAAQELVTRDHVDVIFGGCWSPNALASVPVVNAAKIPFFIVIAVTDGLPAKSPYMIRVSSSASIPSYLAGEWAAKRGWKQGYNAVADYVLGTTAAHAFGRGMEKNGGNIIGEVRLPVSNPDFTPYIQRILTAHPQIVQLSLPSGFIAEDFVKIFHNVGLADHGINLISGDITETKPINELGDFVNGLYDISFYVSDNNNPANVEFMKAFHDVPGTTGNPGFVALTGYDSLYVLRQAFNEVPKGKIDSDALMRGIRGHQFISPRGSIAYDENGEIVENWYLRQATLVSGKMEMNQVATFPMVHVPNLGP